MRSDVPNVLVDSVGGGWLVCPSPARGRVWRRRALRGWLGSVVGAMCLNPVTPHRLPAFRAQGANSRAATIIASSINDSRFASQNKKILAIVSREFRSILRPSLHNPSCLPMRPPFSCWRETGESTSGDGRGELLGCRASGHSARQRRAGLVGARWHIQSSGIPTRRAGSEQSRVRDSEYLAYIYRAAREYLVGTYLVPSEHAADA